jgi:hypothetical protein
MTAVQLKGTLRKDSAGSQATLLDISKSTMYRDAVNRAAGNRVRAQVAREPQGPLLTRARERNIFPRVL